MFNTLGVLTSAIPRRTFTVDTDTDTGWNLITDGFGGSAPPSKVIVTINTTGSTYIAASSTSVPALDLTGLPANSKIILNNEGNIYGAGGNGGAGGGYTISDEPPFSCLTQATPGPQAGFAGGPAIEYDGTNVDLEIYNADGLIFGGGGGGGGGVGCKSTSPCGANGGGGGGGGAGGSSTGGVKGSGGAGGPINVDGDTTGTGSAGSNGTGGPGGVGGSGGAKGTGGAICTNNQTGGAGADFGDTGQTRTGGGGGAGGAGGNAITNNGTGTTTFITGGVEGTDYKGTAE